VSVNEVVLSGTAHALCDLRYTPAGIPVLEFSLRHTSTQTEAGQARKVDVELPAIAFGPLAQRLAQAPQTDRPVMARGFLARRSLRSTQVVLHARDIEFQ
jgi:primosomal replication protein N